jgi:hypothetical protein
MECFSSIFLPSFEDFYTIVLDELVLEVVARHRDDILAQRGFLLVEGCLLFNSEDYSCVICWLFNPYLILFKW